MMEFCFGLLVLLAMACVVLGPSLLIAGGIEYALADCEVLEIVSVLSISPVARGLGMCDASFWYYNSSGHLPGRLTTQCPSNMTTDGATVAVCYPVAHPERYKVAQLEEDLEVSSHGAVLIVLGIGAGLTAIPLLGLLVDRIVSWCSVFVWHMRSKPELGVV